MCLLEVRINLIFDVNASIIVLIWIWFIMSTIHDDAMMPSKLCSCKRIDEEITNHIPCRAVSKLNMSLFNAVRKKYHIFICLVHLLLDALPFTWSNKGALIILVDDRRFDGISHSTAAILSRTTTISASVELLVLIFCLAEPPLTSLFQRT
jgi:hypothetical protein